MNKWKNVKMEKHEKKKNAKMRKWHNVKET